MSDQPDDEEYKLKLKDDNDYQDYKRIFGRMRKEYQVGIRIAVISTNTNAFDDETKTASVEFLPWDALEDVMPFLAWDGTTYDLVATLRGHTDIVRSVAFSSGGPPCIVSGSSDRTIKVWDCATYALLATLTGHTCLLYTSPSPRD